MLCWLVNRLEVAECARDEAFSDGRGDWKYIENGTCDEFTKCTVEAYVFCVLELVWRKTWSSAQSFERHG